MNSLMALHGVRYRQGDFSLAIDELTLQAGRIYAITGPNGAGKSTLLQILALLTVPQGGELHFGGERVSSAATRQRLRRQITLVHQTPYLFSGSVSDNLAFGLSLRGLNRGEQERAICEALATVGLSGFESRPGRELSGGETRRVALARALVLRPQLLLLDEPTAGLDREHYPVLEAGLTARPEPGMTIVITSHDPQQIQRLGAQEIRLYAGTLQL